MKIESKLTSREYEIAGLLAWGASKKEIAEQLFISIRTVENHTKSIFEKLGCKSVNELSAMWFCSHYDISQYLSPRKKLMTFILLLFMLPQIYGNNDDVVRVFRTRTTTSRTCRSSRRKTESDDATFDFQV